MKIYKIQVPIYNVVIELWIGGTEQDFVERMKKLGEELIADGTLGCYIAIRDKKTKAKIQKRILWIQENNDLHLVHEVFHATSEIMAYKGIDLIKDTREEYIPATEEAWAYLMEYLYKKCREKLNNQNTKKETYLTSDDRPLEIKNCAYCYAKLSEFQNAEEHVKRCREKILSENKPGNGGIDIVMKPGMNEKLSTDNFKRI